MILIHLFIGSALCHKTITDVFIGNWSVVTTYCSPEIANETFYFQIFKTTDGNHLKTSEGQLINLSNVDLSGNITNGDSVYYYNFVQVAPPFVSSDIDMGEYGKAHVRISSYNSMHITWVNDGKIVTYFLKKQIPEIMNRGPLINLLFNNWKQISFFSIVIIIQFVYRFMTKRMTEKIYKDEVKMKEREKLMNEKGKVEDKKEKIKND